MSLLLDALKRAEQEKLARHGAGGEPARSLGGEPPSPSLELQPMGAGAAHAPSPPGPRQDPGAHAAQNVFQVKSASAAAAAPAKRNRTMLWLAFGAIGIVALAAGGYVWYYVSALTPRYASTPPARPAPAASSSQAAPTAAAAAAGSIVATGAVPAAGATGAAAPANGLSAVPAAAAAPVAPPPSAPQPSAAERLLREAASAPAQEPLRLKRSNAPAHRVPREVAGGYEALRQGDFATARREYEAALAADPASLDAHLGLATLAARESNRAAAAEHYRRALELDPRNGTALAGLAALVDFSRPEALEVQLRGDIARAPPSAELHFTLGNLYASQSRWTEAQAEYYEAHRLDPGSADIAHNLAVSLDRLGQRRLAAGFYRRALDSAQGRSAQFDAAAVARRLEELR